MVFDALIINAPKQSISINMGNQFLHKSVTYFGYGIIPYPKAYIHCLRISQ